MKRTVHLRVARHRARLTQDQLAALAGVDQRVISSLETRVSNPAFETALKIAGALELDPRVLRFGPDLEAIAS